MRVAAKIVLTEEEHSELTKRVRSKLTAREADAAGAHRIAGG
jgi:hypothetical protein